MPDPHMTEEVALVQARELTTGMRVVNLNDPIDRARVYRVTAPYRPYKVGNGYGSVGLDGQRVKVFQVDAFEVRSPFPSAVNSTEENADA